MVTRKLEQETGLLDSASAIRFAIGSTVLPFWVFPGWHGPVELVTIVNRSVETVTSQHHTEHRGRPAIVTSHNGRYLVLISYLYQ